MLDTTVLHSFNVIFKGYTIFRNIKSKQILLTIKKSSFIDGYTELSAIFSSVLLSVDQIQLQRGTTINITRSKFLTALFSNQLENLIFNAPKEFFSPLYPPCLFQYINRTSLNSQYSIQIKDTAAPKLCTKYFCTSHCYLDDTAETSWNINQQVIYTDNSWKHLIKDYKTICYCADSQNYACLVDELPGIYPGQTLNISLALQFESQPSAIVNVEYNYHNLPKSACKIINTPEIQQEIYNACTQVSYTIEYNDLGWCELFSAIWIKKKFWMQVLSQDLTTLSKCIMHIMLNICLVQLDSRLMKTTFVTAIPNYYWYYQKVISTATSMTRLFPVLPMVEYLLILMIITLILYLNTVHLITASLIHHILT